VAIVYGNLSDINEQPLLAYQPQIVFTPTTPAVGSPGAIYATRPITIDVDTVDGTFQVNLAPTDLLRPSVEYRISLRWLDADGGYQATDFLPWALTVPEDGGFIGDLLTEPANPVFWWVDTVAPTHPVPSLMWFDPVSGNVYKWS
jgi:hypothetical protein